MWASSVTDSRVLEACDESSEGVVSNNRRRPDTGSSMNMLKTWEMRFSFKVQTVLYQQRGRHADDACIMPIAASASRSGINQFLVCGTMGPDGGVLRGLSAQTTAWVNKDAHCWADLADGIWS